MDIKTTQKFSFEFYKCGNEDVVYQSSPVTEEVKNALMKELSNMPLNHFFGIAMKKLGGEVLYFSRHDIGSFRVVGVEVVQEQEANGEAPEVTT